MTFKKIFVASVMFFSMLSISSSTYAKEAHKSIPDILKDIDGKVQAAINAIPAGNSGEIGSLIKEAAESASELSANYKFEFERDKVVLKLKKARELAKKSDFSGAEQELKAAKEGFANLPKFQ
jgi:flavorubredoxin